MLIALTACQEGYNMRPWLVLHMPTRSLVTVVARSRERVLAICRTMGWRSGEVMIRVK